MPNPIAIATKGKGTLALLARARAIASRYGLRAAKMDHALALLADTLRRFECQATFPVTAVALAPA